MKNKIKSEYIDWDFYDHALTLEKEWKRNLPRISDSELLKIFPEAKEVIPEKITEWEKKRGEIFDIIKRKLVLIKERVSDTDSRLFWREYVKLTDGVEFMRIEGHIGRLGRFQSISKGYKVKGWVDNDTIQKVLAVPIESLLSQQFRKSGKTLIGLCPIHNEKYPSFYIYPESNSFWCFGCNRGGDAIKFIRLLYGFNFKQAVEILLEK